MRAIRRAVKPRSISRNGRKARFTRFASAWLWTLAILCLRYVSDAQTAFDLNGKPVDPFSPRPTNATVFVFVRTDCPISNRFAPEVKRLHAEFSPKGVHFWLVYPEGNVASETIRKHATEYAYPGTVLRDPAHRLVEFGRAQVTPEAAVVTPDKKLVYHGRIDDRYVAFGQLRPAPTRRDLELVLAAFLKGEAIPASAPAIGCAIAPAK